MDNNPGKIVHKETLDEVLIHATNLPKDMVFVSDEHGPVHGITNAVEAVPIAYIDPHVMTLNEEELQDAYIDPHIILDKEELSGIRLSDQHLNGIGLSNQQQIEAPTYIRHKNPFPDYEFTPEQGQELLSILGGIRGEPYHSATGKYQKGRPHRFGQVIPEFEYAEIPGPLVRPEDIFVEPSSENTVPRSGESEESPSE